MARARMTRRGAARLGALIAAVACVTPAWSAPLDPAALPGIGPGPGRRETVDIDHAPWLILGRVQTGLGGKCTGFAVAPDVVETAAHCLWIPRTSHYFQPWDVHVLMGYGRGHDRIHATARAIIVARGYDPRREGDTARSDRALLVLDRPVIARADLLPVAVPRPGASVMLAGYQQDRGEIAIGDLHCRIVAGDPGGGDGTPPGLLRHDCAGTRGDSGAPLLMSMQDGRWGIVGVAVIAFAGRGGLAAPVPP